MRYLLLICCFLSIVACSNKAQKEMPLEQDRFEEILAQMYLLEGINNRNFNVNDPGELVKNTNADSLLRLNNISEEDFVATYTHLSLYDKEGLIQMYDRILVRLSLYEETLKGYEGKPINAFDTSATWYQVSTAQSPISADSLETPQ